MQCGKYVKHLTFSDVFYCAEWDTFMTMSPNLLWEPGCELIRDWVIESPAEFSTPCAFYVFSPLPPEGSIKPPLPVLVFGHKYSFHSNA